MGFQLLLTLYVTLACLVHASRMGAGDVGKSTCQGTNQGQRFVAV